MHQGLNDQFPTTHWTLISRARSTDEIVAKRALDTIYTDYQYPLYCYIRRRSFDHYDAEEALQEFMCTTVRNGLFNLAKEEKGRLRGFLSTCLRNFLTDWINRKMKRERLSSSLDELREHSELSAAELRYQQERFSDEDTPEHVFERKWAQELMSRVFNKLGASYAEQGNQRLFQVLSPVLLTGGSLRGEDSEELAAAAGTSRGALRVALTRMLSNYKDILNHEVRDTVDTASEVPAEILYLHSLFTSK